MRKRILAIIMSVAMLSNVSEFSYITAYAAGTDMQSKVTTTSENQPASKESVDSTQASQEESFESTTDTQTNGSQSTDMQGSDTQTSDSQSTDMQSSDTQTSNSQGTEMHDSDTQMGESQNTDKQSSDTQTTDTQNTDDQNLNTTAAQEQEADKQADSTNSTITPTDSVLGEMSQDIPADGTIVYNYEDITIDTWVTMPMGSTEKYYRFVPSEDGWYDISIGDGEIYNIQALEFNAQTNTTTSASSTGSSQGLLFKATAGKEYLISTNKNQSTLSTFYVKKLLPITSITATSPTVNSIYGTNPAITYTGMTITVNYEDGSSEVLSNLGPSVQWYKGQYINISYGESLETPGVHKATLSYLDVQTTVDINFSQTSWTKLELISLPTTMTYYNNANNSWANLEGLVLRPFEGDQPVGDFAYNIPSSGFSYVILAEDGTSRGSSFTNLPAGDYNVRYIYKGCTVDTTNKPLHIVENNVSSIQIAEEPDKTTYIDQVDRYFDLTGLELKVNHSDGTSEVIPYSNLKNYSTRIVGTVNDLRLLSPSDQPYQLEIQYMNQKVTQDFYLVASPVKSMQIITNPTKTTYVSNAEYSLDLYNMKVDVTYMDGSTERISYGQTSTRGYQIQANNDSIEWGNIGTQKAEITYMGYTTEYNINIIENSVSSIKVTKQPDKKEYIMGVDGGVSTYGMTLEVTYTNGEVKTVTPSGNYLFANCENNAFSSIGTKKVTVTYYGAKAAFDINVIANPVQSIEVTKMPDKTEYVVSTVQNLALQGMEITLTYKTGEKKVVSYNRMQDGYYISYNMAGIDFNTLGEKLIPITYMGKSTTCKVNVVDNPIKSIAILTLPTKTTYIRGVDTYINTSGLDLYAVDNNNNKKRVYEGYSYSNISLNRLGTQTVTISYMGRTASYNIEVIDNPVTAIQVISLPEKTKYVVGYDDHLNLEGLSLEVTKGNDSEIIKYGENNDYHISANYEESDFSTTGTKQVTISYMGHDTTFSIQVVDNPVDSITLNTQNAKLTYYAGADNWISESKIGISVHYKTGSGFTDGVYDNLWDLDFIDTHFLTLDEDRTIPKDIAPGTYPVIVTYMGIAASYNITILPSPVSTIEILSQPSVKEFFEFENLNNCDLSGLKFRIHYNNGKASKDITYEQGLRMIDGYTLSLKWKSAKASDEDFEVSYPTLGNNAIELSYMGTTAEIPVMIPESPVKKLEIVTAPVKVYNTFWDFDGDSLWSEKIDLSGLDLKITYVDDSTKTLTISKDNFSSSRQVQDQYKRYLSVNPVYEKNQIKLSYMNQTVLYNYTTSNPDWSSSTTLNLDTPIVTNIQENGDGIIYKFVPAVTDKYKFYSYGSSYPNAGLYNENQGSVAYEDEGDKGLCLVAQLEAGKAYYLTVNTSSAATFHVVVSKYSSATISTKTPIKDIAIVDVEAPVTGATPDLTGSMSARQEASIKSISWVGMSANDTFRSGQKYTLSINLKVEEGFEFTNATMATINGKRVVTKKYNSDGTYTLYYTFDYTKYQVTLPTSNLYTLIGDAMATYGNPYTFTMVPANGAVLADFKVKANDTILTPTSNGVFTISTVNKDQTIVVKRLADVVPQAGEHSVSFNQTDGTLFDKIVVPNGGKVAALAAPENVLPVLESTDTDFFMGWYDAQGTRFTPNTAVTTDLILTAKWCDRVIQSTYNGYSIYYKLISISDNNRVKVQVGTGSGIAVQQATASTEPGYLLPQMTTGGIITVPGGFPATVGGNPVQCEVTAVGDGAFQNCMASGILLPGSIERFGTGVFSGCVDLTRIDIPNAVTIIPENTFSGCTSLAVVNLAAGTTAIGSGAFGSCSSLTEISIPSTLESIAPTAFTGAGSGAGATGTEFICTPEVTEVLSNAGITSDKISTVSIAFDYAYSDLSMQKGTTKTLTVMALEGSSDVSNQVSWASSDTNVVTLSSALGKTVTLTGTNSTASPATVTASYKGILQEVEVNVLVSKTNIESDSNIEIANIANQIYSGNALIPTITVKNNSTILTQNVDYTVSYPATVNVGTVVVSITGIGAYEGTVNKNFTIEPYNLSNCTVGDIGTQTYNGGAITPEVSVNKGSIMLVQNADYTVEYSNNTNTGTATLTLTGKGNYTGTSMKNFTIEPINLANCTVGDIGTQTYNGGAITPEVSVNKGSITLAQNSDYAVGYSNNTNAGTATITLTGKGNYTGTATKNFTIGAKSIDNATVDSVADVWSTGSEQRPTPSVKMDSTSLTKDRDYSINYNNNTNAGTASIIIKGIGNYTGTKTINFRIISSLDKVAGVSATANNEKTIELTWNQVSCASGYEIYIYKDAKKKYVKLDSVNHNSYTSKKLTAGATYKYKVRAFINVNGKTVYGSYSDVYKASTCTKKPSISAKVSKTNATISWKAVKGASGYEVYMSTSKNGDYEQIGTTTKNSKVTFTKKKLTKKQTYYFKVRTYIIVNKVKVFSDYSSVKSVKVK